MNEDGSSTVVVTAFSDAANGDIGINASANNWAHYRGHPGGRHRS